MSSHLFCQHADEKKKIMVFFLQSLKCQFWRPFVIGLGETDPETVNEREILWEGLETKDSMAMLTAERLGHGELHEIQGGHLKSKRSSKYFT